MTADTSAVARGHRGSRFGQHSLVRVHGSGAVRCLNRGIQVIGRGGSLWVCDGDDDRRHGSPDGPYGASPNGTLAVG